VGRDAESTENRDTQQYGNQASWHVGGLSSSPKSASAFSAIMYDERRVRYIICTTCMRECCFFLHFYDLSLLYAADNLRRNISVKLFLLHYF